MIWLRQSTARVVKFGPGLDKTDAVALEVGLATAMDNTSTGIRICKNAGTLAARSATVTATTYDAFGMYNVTFSATDVGTLGDLIAIYSDPTTNLYIREDYIVQPANVYDSLILGSDYLDVSLAEWRGTQPLTLSSQRVQTDMSGSLTAAERNAVADAFLARTLGTESYSADGAVPTLAQALFEILSELFEKSISGTTVTYKKRNGSTTAMTSTLNSSTVPTSVSRTT